MTVGYSVAQTARLVCALRWTCSRLSQMLEVWAAQAAAVPAHAGAAVAMSELARRLASHREALDDLQPDSEAMAPWRRAAPADPSLAEALDQIAALEGSQERLDVAREVLVPHLVGTYRQIGEQAAPHCDGALASVARSLGHDLRRDHLARRTVPRGAVRSEAVGEAVRVLSAAGGIVGPSVLRPSGPL